MTDDDCRRIYNEAMELPNRNAVSVMRYIIAAYQAKLLAVMEMPSAFSMEDDQLTYTYDQLQQYAAACAAQAREKALSEAMQACRDECPTNDGYLCIDAIKSLKWKQA